MRACSRASVSARIPQRPQLDRAIPRHHKCPPSKTVGPRNRAEITPALDPILVVEVTGFLRKLVTDIAIILVTHRIGFASTVCDRGWNTPEQPQNYCWGYDKLREQAERVYEPGFGC